MLKKLSHASRRVFRNVEVRVDTSHYRYDDSLILVIKKIKENSTGHRRNNKQLNKRNETKNIDNCRTRNRIWWEIIKGPGREFKGHEKSANTKLQKICMKETRSKYGDNPE